MFLEAMYLRDFEFIQFGGLESYMSLPFLICFKGLSHVFGGFRVISLGVLEACFGMTL